MRNINWIRMIIINLDSQMLAWLVWVGPVRKYPFILNIVRIWQCRRLRTLLRTLLSFKGEALMRWITGVSRQSRNITYVSPKVLLNKLNKITINPENLTVTKTLKNSHYIDNKMINSTNYWTAVRNLEVVGGRWAVWTRTLQNKLNNYSKKNRTKTGDPAASPTLANNHSLDKPTPTTALPYVNNSLKT